jgi:ADP-ribosylglycohydrolase
MVDTATQNRVRGCAVGAAVGDALGMPLEFGPRRPLDRLVREMEPGRIPAGTFTDDTEMTKEEISELAGLAHPWIQGVAQAIADQAPTNRKEHDGRADRHVSVPIFKGVGR